MAAKDAQFWPENTESVKFEQLFEPTIQDLIDTAKLHFGEGVNLECVQLDRKSIHTHCINYDLYDPSDWTSFYIFTHTDL